MMVITICGEELVLASPEERGRWPRVRFGERDPIEPLARRLIMDRDGRQCKFCGSQCELQLDHVVPWSAGGSDRSDNLRVLCRSCNIERSNFRDSVMPRTIPVAPVCDGCIRGAHDEMLDNWWESHQWSMWCWMCQNGSWPDAETIHAYCGTCEVVSYVFDWGSVL